MVLAVIVAFLVVSYIFSVLISILYRNTTYYFLKYFFYSRIHKYMGDTTRFHAFFIIVLLMRNAFCLTVGTQNRIGILQRSGLLSTVNLVPLALGCHMDSIISFCGLGYETYSTIHRWIGRVAVLSPKYKCCSIEA